VIRNVVVPLVLAATTLGASQATAQTASPSTAKAASQPPKALPDDVRDLAIAVDRAGAESATAASRYTGEFASPQRSDLAARTAGRVGAVLVDEGSLVEAGQPMLELETDYLDLEIKRAEAELARAQAALVEAERDAARKKELVAKGSVSEAAGLRSESAFAQTKAMVAGADASLALAKTRRADATLRAPFRGVVEARRVDVGERLTDMSAAPFVLVQVSPLKLRFRVPERDLARVKRGQIVEAEVDAYAGLKFRGTVSVVGGAVDPASRTFLAEARFENRDLKLRPGMFARIRLLSSAAKR
jgi:membrane fusion protein (multidrug efflux system)